MREARAKSRKVLAAAEAALAEREQANYRLDRAMTAFEAGMGQDCFGSPAYTRAKQAFDNAGVRADAAKAPLRAAIAELRAAGEAGQVQS